MIPQEPSRPLTGGKGPGYIWINEQTAEQGWKHFPLKPACLAASEKASSGSNPQEHLRFCPCEMASRELWGVENMTHVNLLETSGLTCHLGFCSGARHRALGMNPFTSQTVVHRPAVSASPRNLPEMQILGLLLDLRPWGCGQQFVF